MVGKKERRGAGRGSEEAYDDDATHGSVHPKKKRSHELNFPFPLLAEC